jgi:hypothetical protein
MAALFSRREVPQDISRLTGAGLEKRQTAIEVLKVFQAQKSRKIISQCHTAWETVILVPTDQPLKALARALIPLLEPSMDEVEHLVKATKLAEHFRLREVSLSDIVERHRVQSHSL